MSETFLADEQATLAFAKQFAATLEPGQIVYLKGKLGAGKTTFVRGVLRALGFDGAVKSPTYAILETYDLEKFHVIHMDLYRMQDPHELEFLGLDHYFNDPKMIALIEWPEKGEQFLPSATTEMLFDFVDEGRVVNYTPPTQIG